MDLARARMAAAGLTAPPGFVDHACWEGRFLVEKFDSEEFDRLGYGLARPYEVVEGRNLLLTSGANVYHRRLISATPTVFDGTNARIAVGDGTAAAAAAQTDLQGATKFRKLVDAAPTVSGNTIAAVATFGSSEANFAWNEAAIVNATSGGDMLNRVVQFFGTKASGATWVMTGTIALT